jgi:phage repressor protein C with HTH and peptisase S24 domain/DNA-binding XRE family transcriptional regulator
MSIIGNESKKCRKHLRMTLPEMADRMNVSTTTIVNYETGRRMPDIDFLIDFSVLSKREFLYWLGLRVSASKVANSTAVTEAINHAMNAPEQAFVSLPYVDINDISNTDGSPIGVRATDEIPQFSKSWLERELNAHQKDLCLAPVVDDSMTPTLRPGDTILLDRRATRPEREGIYIIRLNGVSLIKRLQILPDAIVKLSSDNPAYETFTVSLNDFNGRDISIIGRVVWVIWAGRRI